MAVHESLRSLFLAVLFRMHIFLKELRFLSEKRASVALPLASSTSHRPGRWKVESWGKLTRYVQKPAAVSLPGSRGMLGRKRVTLGLILQVNKLLYAAIAETRLKRERVELNRAMDIKALYRC